MKRLATLCLGFVLLGVEIGGAEPVIGSGTLSFEGRVTIQEANEMIFALKEKLKREPEPSPPPPVPAWETPIMTLTENVHPELQYPEPVNRPVTVTKKVSTRSAGKKRSKQKTSKGAGKVSKPHVVPSKSVSQKSVAPSKAAASKPTGSKTAKKSGNAANTSVAKATKPRSDGANARSNPAKSGASASKKKGMSKTGT